jgi:hypothetical protein
MTIFRQEVRPCRRVAGARRGHSGGELDARSGDRAVHDPSPRRCSFRARPPLHGAAAISARADVGLLRLVEALDKAGIGAEVLPTAVTIDKRASDGDKGYSASLEREAGVGAVSALDDYRASVLEGIKGGKEVPAFDWRTHYEAAGATGNGDCGLDYSGCCTGRGACCRGHNGVWFYTGESERPRLPAIALGTPSVANTPNVMNRPADDLSPSKMK